MKSKKNDLKNKILKAIGKEVGIFLLYITIFAVVMVLLQTFVIQRTRVSGRSMEPTLSDGDVLFVDKISYNFSDPERFDIIPFEYEDGVYYIKRIIGLPGESVRIDESGIIYINGEVLTESYGKEVIYDAGIAINEITLGDDEYFVLGDNRNNSQDSRSANVGNIKRSDIMGRAFFRLSPLSKLGFL